MHTEIKNILVFLSHTQTLSLRSGNHQPLRPSVGVMQPWPPLAVCRLLAINAHFTHSSTPLALNCVTLDILHAGSNSTLLFHFVWSTDGLHGPRRKDWVFQVFSSGSRGDQGRILGSAKPLAAFSQMDYMIMFHNGLHLDGWVGVWVSKMGGWMDGSIDQCMDRWMGIRCHIEYEGGAQLITAPISPAEECKPGITPNKGLD